MFSRIQTTAIEEAENLSVQSKPNGKIELIINNAKAKRMRDDYELIGLGVFHPRLKIQSGLIEKRLKGFSFPRKELELALYGRELIDNLGNPLTPNIGIHLAFGKHNEEEGGELTLILYGLNENGKLNDDEDDFIFDYTQACPDNCPDNVGGVKF